MKFKNYQIQFDFDQSEETFKAKIIVSHIVTWPKNFILIVSKFLRQLENGHVGLMDADTDEQNVDTHLEPGLFWKILCQTE